MDVDLPRVELPSLESILSRRPRGNNLLLHCVVVERRRWHSGKALWMEMQSYDGSDHGAVGLTSSQTGGMSTPPPHTTATGRQWHMWT